MIYPSIFLKQCASESKLIVVPRRFQLFSAIATAPKGSGYTLFAESRLFFQYLPAPYTLPRLQAVKWRLLNVGFWQGKLQNMSLVVPHPVTGVPCLRWHESWPESKTKYSTSEVRIENDDQEIVEMVDQLLYDRRVCLRFGWERGDILLADNTSMMHARTAFTDDSERELWRIHLDEMQVNVSNDE